MLIKKSLEIFLTFSSQKRHFFKVKRVGIRTIKVIHFSVKNIFKNLKMNNLGVEFLNLKIRSSVLLRFINSTKKRKSIS